MTPVITFPRIPAIDPIVFDSDIIGPAYLGLISNIFTQNPLCEKDAPHNATVVKESATDLSGIRAITKKRKRRKQKSNALHEFPYVFQLKSLLL